MTDSYFSKKIRQSPLCICKNLNALVTPRDILKSNKEEGIKNHTSTRARNLSFILFRTTLSIPTFINEDLLYFS